MSAICPSGPPAFVGRFVGTAVAASADRGSDSGLWAALAGPGRRALRRATHRRAAAAQNRLRWYGMTLALALAAALLLAFQAVVQQAVQQGDARREAVAQQTETWSACNRLHGRAARDDCRSQTEPPSSARLGTLSTARPT